MRIYSHLDTGGIERQLLRVLPRLAARGNFAPTLMLTRRDGELAEQLRQSGVAVDLFSFRGRLKPSVIRQMAARFRVAGTRIVHAHRYEANTTGTVAAWWAGLPSIATLHSVQGLSWRRRCQERVINRMRSAIVAVSERTLEHYLQAIAPFPRRRCSVLYNGIDAAAIARLPRQPREMRARFGFPQEAQVIVCAARLIEEKRQIDLIEAVGELRHRLPAVRLLLLGEGPTRAALEAAVAERGLGAYVRIAGNLPDAVSVIASADVAALVSSREGFSNVVLEAMAAGVPQVLTDVGGNREAIGPEGPARFLEHVGDLPSLIRALERWLLSENDRQAARVAALERVKHFDLDRTIDATEALYQQLLSDAAVRRD